VPTFQVSVPEDVTRVIYDLTEKTGETVPGWIRDAALQRLEREGFRICAECGRMKPVKAFDGDSRICKSCARRAHSRPKGGQ